MRFAELALLVLDHTPESAHAIDARVRATAHVGNAVRIRGALKEAGFIVETARWIMNREQIADPLTAAELNWIEGALRRDQRRFDESLHLLQQATIAYQQYGEPYTAYRAALSLGLVYQDMGDYAWVDGGHTEQAAALFEVAEEYLSQADQLTQIRCTWIKGKIAKGLGDLRAAESYLRAAIHGMQRHEKPYDVALLHLELSTVLLAADRADEVRALAEELVTVFDGLGVHREAITALALYRDAVALDQISESEISELAAYLRAAAVAPGLAWRVPV